MKVDTVEQQVTASTKKMIVTYEEQEYEVYLYWNNCDGYEIDFIGADTPEWAIEWDDNNDESLAYTLDSLSDELLEEVK